jgi:hypothetical protein
LEDQIETKESRKKSKTRQDSTAQYELTGHLVGSGDGGADEIG